MRPCGDDRDEMTTAADDSADEIAFEAFLAGRPVPGEADGGAPAVAAFAGAVRATATEPGRPNAALAELLATGLLTDQSSPSTRTAPSAGRTPRRSRVRRRRLAMFFPALLAKFLAAGAIAQAATGAGITVVVVTAAGATGVLGDGVQHTISSVVSAETPAVPSGTTDGETSADETEPVETEPVETPAVESPAAEAPAAAEAAFDAKAWADGPTVGQTFGEWVSQGAHNKDALEAAAARAGAEDLRFGQIVSKWAKMKHVPMPEVEGIEDGDTPAAVAPAPTTKTESGDSEQSSHGGGSGRGNSEHSGGGGNGRGHN
jgi:uncharacterized membrane protein YgcG